MRLLDCVDRDVISDSGEMIESDSRVLNVNFSASAARKVGSENRFMIDAASC